MGDFRSQSSEHKLVCKYIICYKKDLMTTSVTSAEPIITPRKPVVAFITVLNIYDSAPL